MHFSARWSLVPMLMLTACSFAGQRIGSGATRGAMTELGEQIRSVPVDDQGIISERNARAAVRGALEELSSEERKEQLSSAIAEVIAESLQRAAHPSGEPGTGGSGGAGGPPVEALSRQIAQGIAEEVTSRLRAELAPDGSGPLATALSGTAERLGGSVTRGALDELTVLTRGCAEVDPQQCLEARAQGIARAAVGGALEGLRLPLWLLVFVLGAALSLLAERLFVHLRRAGRG